MNTNTSQFTEAFDMLYDKQIQDRVEEVIGAKRCVTPPSCGIHVEEKSLIVRRLCKLK